MWQIIVVAEIHPPLIFNKIGDDEDELFDGAINSLRRNNCNNDANFFEKNRDNLLDNAGWLCTDDNTTFIYVYEIGITQMRCKKLKLTDSDS